MTTLRRFRPWLAIALAAVGCSSSSGAPATSGQDHDAAACVGLACTSSAQGDGGSTSPDGGDSGAVMAVNGAPLCTENGPLGSPLPSGIAIVEDTHETVGAADETVIVSGTDLFYGDRATVRRVALGDGSMTTYVDHTADSFDDQVIGLA